MQGVPRRREGYPILSASGVRERPWQVRHHLTAWKEEWKQSTEVLQSTGAASGLLLWCPCLLPKLASPVMIGSGKVYFLHGKSQPLPTEMRPILWFSTGQLHENISAWPSYLLSLSDSVMLVEHQVPVELPTQAWPNSFSPSPLLIKWWC